MKRLRELIVLSIPIALSNVLSLLSVLVNSSILAGASSHYLYMMTLFLPLNFWVIALFESCRVPATALSASLKCDAERSGLAPLLCFLLLVTSIGIAIPLLLFMLSPACFNSILGLHDFAHQDSFRAFVIFMLCANCPLAAFYILQAALNGIRRERLALMLMFAGFIVSTSLLWLLVHGTHLSLLSLPIAIAVTYSMLLCVVVFVLRRENIRLLSGYRNIFCKDSIVALKKLAIPVWITYVAIALMLYVYTQLLMPYGAIVVAGFGIAYRLQTLLMLPAIAMGVAAGILINNRQDHSRHVMLSMMVSCMILYSILSVIIYCSAENLIMFMTSDVSIIHAASHYLRVLCFSYIGFSIVLSFSMISEQLGRGIQSLCLMVTMFLLTISLASIGSHDCQQPDALYFSIAFINIFFGFLIFLWVARLNHFNIFQQQHRSEQHESMGFIASVTD